MDSLIYLLSSYKLITTHENYQVYIFVIIFYIIWLQ